jgi:hypothetical protein
VRKGKYGRRNNKDNCGGQTDAGPLACDHSSMGYSTPSTINDRMFDELYDLVEEIEAEVSLRVSLLRVQIRTIS